jgi:hypothetical protein
MDCITHLDTLSHRFLFCFYSCPFGRDSHDIRHFAIQSLLLAFGYPAFVVLLSLTIYVGVISCMVGLAWFKGWERSHDASYSTWLRGMVFKGEDHRPMLSINNEPLKFPCQFLERPHDRTAHMGSNYLIYSTWRLAPRYRFAAVVPPKMEAASMSMALSNCGRTAARIKPSPQHSSATSSTRSSPLQYHLP